MPRLPDIEDMGARPTPVSRRQVASVRNAGAVGEAVSDIGGKAFEIVNRLEQIKDEDDVRRLDIEHAEKAREIRQKAREAKGLNAQAAREEAETALERLNGEFVARARSNQSKSALELLVTRRAALERDSIGEHALRETTATMESAMTARIDTAIQQAEEMWDNPEAVETGINTAVQEVRSRGKWKGADPAQVANEENAVRSRVRGAIVEQRIGADDYSGAQAYLDAHRGEIDHERETRLRKLINGELHLQMADGDAALVLSGNAPAQSEKLPPGETAFMPPVRAESRTVQGGQYGAPRRYGGHVGKDFAAPAGTPIYPMAEGVVRKAYYSEEGGNTVEVEMAGGWKMRVLHMDRPALASPGQSVGVNDIIGGIGNTGTASKGNHAHVEVFNPKGERVNPSSVIGSVQRTPPPNGRRIDIENAYARIDAMPWSDSRKRRARDRVQQVAGENDLIRSRAEQDADREITEALVGMNQGGKRLTAMSQLPASALSRASPNTILQLQQQIEANNKPEPAAPNGQLMAGLTILAATEPNQFLGAVNPELYRGVLPDSEVMELHNMRLRIQDRKGPQPSEILSMISLVLPTAGVVSGKGDKREKQEAQIKSVVLRGVQRRLSVAGKAEVTQDDILRAVRAELTVVTPAEGGDKITVAEARERGIPLSTKFALPTNIVAAVDRNLRALGLAVTAQNRFNMYLENKAEFDALGR